MTQIYEGPRTWTSGETLSQYRRVKPDGATEDQVVYADAGEPGVGTLRDEILTSGDPATVLPHSPHCTAKMVAAGAIAVFETVFPAADGKVSVTPVGPPLGIALEAASADGSIIEVLQLPQADLRLRGPAGPGVHGFFEDFEANSLDSDRFVVTASDGGSAAHSDGVGGVVQLGPSDSSVGDNDEIYLHQTQETFKFALGKPLVFEARVKITEAATNAGNFIVGLADAVNADQLQDNGAGPAASYSGAAFHKLDGGTTWIAEASVGTTQDTDSSGITRTSAAWVVLRIEFEPGSAATDGTVRFYVDGVLAHTASSFDYTSATDMEAYVGVKNGGTNEELMDVDYIACWQAR